MVNIRYFDVVVVVVGGVEIRRVDVSVNKIIEI